MIWEKYTKASNYQDENAIIKKSDKCWKMYLGDQWYGLDNKEDLPVMNFVEPVVNYKVSTICKSTMTAHYSDVEGSNEFAAVYDKLNSNFTANWERGHMDTVAWQTLKAAAIVGDGYTYWGTEDLTKTQVIPCTSVLLGDEQQPDIQKQPYIMIRERLFVDDVRKMALENGIEPAKAANITADEDNDFQIGNKKDIDYGSSDGKVLSVLYFEKRDGIVWTGRAVKNLEYEPLHPMAPMKQGAPLMEKGLKSYPIVNLIWQDIPNSARGQGEVKKLIPNQVEVNKTYARRAMATKMYAYPRMAYMANSIKNPEDLDKVGVAIGMNEGSTGQSIQQLISYLMPASSSPDAKVLSDDLMTTTRELTGAGDTSMGQIDPTRVSGTAIVAIQDQASLSLNEQVSKYKQYVEDIARLWFDLLVAYNPNGIPIKREMTPEEEKEATDGGRIMLEPDERLVPDKITPDELEQLRPEVKVDVSTNTQWSKNDEQTADDNLLANGHITFEEYVELIPDDGILQKNQLQEIIRRRKAQPMDGEAPPEEGPEEAPPEEVPEEPEETTE